LPPCSAAQVVASISRPSANEHGNRSSSKHAGSAAAERLHDLTPVSPRCIGFSLSRLLSKNNLLPRALMKDAITALQEDDQM